MKNKFLKSLGIVAFFVSALIIFSCSKENSENKNEVNATNKALELLEKKNNIIKVDDTTILNALKQLVDQNNENSFFQTKNKNEYFIITKIGNKSTLVKGSLDNKVFIKEKKFELLDNMDDSGNGNLIIKNINEGIELSQKYNNGKFINTILISSNTSNSNRGLCQRENGETFSQCNSRETEEFCDDFISTVAYISNPIIPILIAAVCSC